MRSVLSSAFACLALVAPSAAAAAPSDLPQGFTETVVLDGLESPASFAFAPDGRMFFSERIAGHLRVATETSPGVWQVDAEPYATFDVPRENGVPTAHRSSGVRGFAFDPDFEQNGLVYVFYMKNNPRQNRVVRIQQNPADPSRALSGETLLLELPFNSSSASGSHNGGALRFGTDGMLYITTGDGWSGGDSVQSLSTMTGKLLRIRPDGSIPSDNPFYAQASGDHRAIYALGLRNPYTLTREPLTGQLLIGEANGADKADVLRVEAGANYRHQGYGGIGTSRGRWVNGANAGNKMITGGAWYPAGGPFPSQYHGAYFIALWGVNGSNGGPPGQISTIRSLNDSTVTAFATDVGTFDGAGTRLKPVHLRVGPDGSVYYLLTSYMTGAGQIVRLSYTSGTTVAAPSLSPGGGTYPGPVDVQITSATPSAQLRYTLDGTDPGPQSPAVAGPVTIAATSTLRARAFVRGAASSITSADYTISTTPNLPPVVLAGPPQIAEVGQVVVLNGAATTDPDGDDLLLSDQWTQISGPGVTLGNSDETAAYFLAQGEGTYRFRLTVTDGFDSASDDTIVHVRDCVSDVTDSLVGRWSFEEQRGALALDSAAGLWNGLLEGPTWGAPGMPYRGGSLTFDGTDDVVQIGAPDVSGTAMTMSAWIRPDDFGVQDARILSKASGVSEDDHLWMLSTIAVGAEHRLRARVKTGAETLTLIAFDGALEPGQWAFVAATYDGRRVRLYKDGLLVGEAAKSGSLATSPNVPAAIGNQPQGGRAFDGLIDEVRVYSRALSRRELLIVGGLTKRRDCMQQLGAGGR